MEGDGEAEDAVARAAKITDKADSIVTALRAFAAFGRDRLARNDAASKALVESIGLTFDEITAAEQAAGALDAAGTDRRIEGRVVVRDLPAVNRAQGHVLLEMRGDVALRERQREEPRGAQLLLGKATRSALAPRTAGKAMGEPVAVPPAAGG